MSDETARNGRLPLAVASDHVLGGHALCLVGYNDERRELKFINSWGKDWGDHGYGYMPYDYADRFVTESCTPPTGASGPFRPIPIHARGSRPSEPCPRPERPHSSGG